MYGARTLPGVIEVDLSSNGSTATRERWLWLAFACAIPCITPAVCVGQSPEDQVQTLLDRVPLPAAYKAKAFRYLNEEQEPSQRIEVWTSQTWSVCIQSLAQPGIGFVPFDYVYAMPTESWRYAFDQRRAVRTNSFAERGYSALEANVSPMWLTRALRSDEVVVHGMRTEESGSISVTLTRAGRNARDIVTFDPSTGALTRFQALAPSGEIQVDVRFEDWRSLPSGALVPFQVYKASRSAVASDPPWHSTMLLSEVEEIEPTSPPTRLPPASDFTIVDEIEGVSKKPDGTVLGPIERESRPAGLTSGRLPGTTGLGSRTIVLIGVGLILLAGIVFGIRRWKGA